MSHTPGPWTTSKKNGRIIEASGIKIATANPPSVRDAPQAWSNARLIAAAPDLLEACRAVAAWAKKSCGTSREAVDLCNAAIAKAEGVE